MIGSLVSASMRLRALVVVIAAIVMAVGVTRMKDMPVDVFPEILPVTVHVHTEALGLSAVEVEQLITVPIEADLLAGTPWVEVMRSESVPGLSSIELEFKRGTNPMHARQVVQERLTQAHALPNVSQPPLMLQPLSATNRIMIIGVSSKTQSPIEMSVLARWTIRPRLLGIQGVSNVAIWGQRERQIQVQIDPARLRGTKVSVVDIIKTAGNSLWFSPLTFLEASVAGTGGFIETPNQRLGVRHVLPITTAADLAKVPVEGTNIPLGDLTTVVEDHQPLIGDASNAGGPALLLVVEKLPGVNTLAVSDKILEALDALKPGVGGIEFDPTIYSPATYIRTSLGNVGRAVLIALGLLALLLLILSHSWRAALIGLLAIPLSVMAAVLVTYWMGATLNAMVLAGLLIAVALIIDDAILYSYSLMKRLQSGTGTSIANALFGALADARGPMMFATAAVLLAAVPALFVAGTPGALLNPLVVTYALAVLASMVTAMTLTPALAMLLLQNAQPPRQDTALAGWARSVSEGLSPVVPRLVTALLVIAGIAGLFLLPRLGMTPAPNFKEPDLLVHWDAVPGTSRQAMNRTIDRVARELRAIPGVRNVGAHVGRAMLSDEVVGIHSSDMWVNLAPGADYEKSVSAVEDIVAGYPGIEGEVLTFLRSRFDDALSRLEDPLVIRMFGQEEHALQAEAEKLTKALAGINGIVDPRLEEEVHEPVVEVEVDLAAARAHGVKPGDVRRAAATLISGILVGNLFEEQKIFEVVVWGVPHVRHSVAGINNLMIDTPNGGQVRLGDVAKVRIVSTPIVLRRENVARTLDIVAGVKGRSVEAVNADVRKHIATTGFPLEYRAELVGDYARQEASYRRVAMAVVGVAIAMVFILQATFGNWAMAFAVVLTLPIAASGGILAAAMCSTAPSLAAMGGLLGVVAVAVRQSVMLVGRYRSLRTRDGMSFGPELVKHGIGDHAAPILMTALLTVAALLPFAFFGARVGHEVLGPLAVVIMGGLVTATLYSLCVVPALYARFGAGAMPDAVEADDLEAGH